MANKRKTGKRSKSGRLSRAKQEVERRRKEEEKMQIQLAKPGAPNRRVLERRNLFAFVRPTKGPDGRHGSIDQDICDGIGQMHALGLLDGHGHDPQDMRDRGREWGNHYARLLKGLGMKTANYERMAKGVQAIEMTPADYRFDRMDNELGRFERQVLMSLIVDPMIGDHFGQEVVPWAQSLIDQALMERGLFPTEVIRFPDMEDREYLSACIRGLCQLVDGALPQRRIAA